MRMRDWAGFLNWLFGKHSSVIYKTKIYKTFPRVYELKCDILTEIYRNSPCTMALMEGHPNQRCMCVIHIIHHLETGAKVLTSLMQGESNFLFKKKVGARKPVQDFSAPEKNKPPVVIHPVTNDPLR